MQRDSVIYLGGYCNSDTDIRRTMRDRRTQRKRKGKVLTSCGIYVWLRNDDNNRETTGDNN